MRLYPKKLRSIADLEREKKLLMKESKRLDKDEFLSVGGLLGKGGNNASLVDMLPISNPLVAKVAKIALNRLMKKDKAPKATPVAEDRGERQNSLLKKAAIEFIGGYLKWKAVELSYKGIKHLVKKRSEAKKEL
jgi:hypothetical protein